MTRARPSSRFGMTTPLLLLANVALAGAVWHAATLPIDTSPLVLAGREAVSAPPVRTVGADTAREAPHASALSETLARPLFRADRRPAQPRAAPAGEVDAPPSSVAVEAPVEVAPPPSLPEGLRLVGIATSPRTPARALLRMKSVKHGVWLKAGEDVEGWRIAEIGNGEVWLEAGGHRQMLSLEVSLPQARESVATEPE